MIGLPEIAALALAAAVGWLVWDTLRARERANDAMRAACEARGLLFLDDTVSLASLRPVRDADGRMRLRRIYRFQFSDTYSLVHREYNLANRAFDRSDALKGSPFKEQR